ncbi:uncharacterized protein LOC128567619 [Nycticebus coucang]|uniref:uncharacterized protein LOC128567619 n=1 Tax=Nycticebus coucang TaxID=9470 RepID=UPI00234CA732|nr:uncharacterized protein LOC128567619 [Nycticebus coucang]XP_053420937.1 uncharacterized protein LOC128567619 [Nycticebus coucang]XP_053420938.1 uncharacterized protein LOC128567619 [Nycticebus coucang]XP_053420939.1 uncharacterized protein LOC128567619 [Nycticebus coucang]XP_053420940.1 uncharacterized protein LOC128567619 [Nycticebus coucang]XP_053420941.1 uncharacterized protein LOC128567619 [Nycticebus coucang]XP_053420942.1 uncharacterized protein LOC128567619 [Nycticebus coucang]XP_0
MLPVQRRKLDPLSSKPRNVRKVVRAKRMRKSKRKKKREAKCPPILPTPSAPPQSEDETMDNSHGDKDNPHLPSKERVQSQQDEGCCVMHQEECQIQSCELPVPQESGPSSPAVTSLASPPLCFGGFLSCVCQTFSRSRKQKPPRRTSNKQAEAGHDAEVLRPGLLRGLGKNKVLPHQSL